MRAAALLPRAGRWRDRQGCSRGPPSLRAAPSIRGVNTFAAAARSRRQLRTLPKLRPISSNTLEGLGARLHILTTMRLRVATPADWDAVAGLLEASYHAAMDDLYRPEAVAAMCAPRRELLASGRYYIVEDEGAGGAAVGAGGWSLSSPASVRPGGAHLRHFATRPEHAGRGVARSIAVRCEVDARRAGARVLRVCASLCAVAFYERCGFRLVREMDVVIGGVDVAVELMEKVIT